MKGSSTVSKNKSAVLESYEPLVIKVEAGGLLLLMKVVLL
jgi:hypothetical protein